MDTLIAVGNFFSDNLAVVFIAVLMAIYKICNDRNNRLRGMRGKIRELQPRLEIRPVPRRSGNNYTLEVKIINRGKTEALNLQLSLDGCDRKEVISKARPLPDIDKNRNFVSCECSFILLPEDQIISQLIEKPFFYVAYQEKWLPGKKPTVIKIPLYQAPGAPSDTFKYRLTYKNDEQIPAPEYTHCNYYWWEISKINKLEFSN
ncbi:hypothetical protein ACFL4X_00985 [Gemmatimonadota bacterium]